MNPGVAYVDERVNAGNVRRRVRSLAVAALAVTALILSFDVWVRSVSTIDTFRMSAGPMTRIQAASCNGRLVLAMTRLGSPRSEDFSFRSKRVKPGENAVVLQHPLRIVYFLPIGPDTAGFFWEYDKGSFVCALPYWFVTSLAAAVAACSCRIWWLRRTGRLW